MTEQKQKDELVEEVENDFLRRQEERRHLERGWQLDMNFVSGNQYCDVNSAGEIYEEDKKYFWQTRRVFNHIASIVDMRCAKLGRLRPAVTVLAASEEEKDRHSAELSAAILSAVKSSCDLDAVISEATVWSETCGTAFYKIVWDNCSGNIVGVNEENGVIYDGAVRICALSPFEIYPYSLSEQKLELQPSIIHAKTVPVQDIYSMYGVKLAGRDIDEFSLSPYSVAGGSAKASRVLAVRHACELVIERYTRPTADLPEGRLTVVAGGKLLYDGDLPYINGEEESRGYPFIKQTSVPLAGSFFGASVVDRMIPLQRAYNAVKNRKHEFLNRISMGCVAVEDGSVDCDELIEDGLTPGKVIVYRQGGKPPEMLTLGSLPDGFTKEEENLLSEFSKVAGTEDITQNTFGFSGVTSATGLQLIIEQDDARLTCAYDSIKRAMVELGRQTLRLYRQFASDVRLLKYAGKNNALELFYFKGSDISSDDVVLEADSEANLTPAQKRAAVFEMLDKGLFSDKEGNLSTAAKNKILELLGYKGFGAERDLTELNLARAGKENLELLKGDKEVKPYDDHDAHITEHLAFILTEELSPEAEARLCAHIERHKFLKTAGYGAVNIKNKEAEDGQS